MHFAFPLPWWLTIAVAAAIVGLAVAAYRRPFVTLSQTQRGTLIALRALSLAAIVVFLCRPIVQAPPEASGGVVVPMLVDTSRSMRILDADGQTRIARASSVVHDLMSALAPQFTVDLYSVGDSPVSVQPDRLTADARHSNVSAALEAIRERYRGRRVPGIVVLSDGADTSGPAPSETGRGPSLPVFAVGIGSADGVADREILGVTAGDPRIDQSSIDLHVSAVSSHFGREPFQIRVLANGRLLESRTVTPADGSPVDALFTIAPDPLNATIYTAEIAGGTPETIVENNTRSVLVSPAGRKRLVLALEGAPAHEHSFMTRALTADSSLELESVVRKGKNDSGQGTFLVQAGGGRASLLTSGFPSTKEALYGYDALLIANVEGDFFTHAQLAQAAEFVAERGGGLLVLGGRSFAQRGLIGTPLEEVLPVELNDRRAGLMRATVGTELPVGHNVVALTPEGAAHPVMRLGTTVDETRRLWSALPALASNAPLGGPRPGASVLAVVAAPGGAVYPVVAVQRYGRGRSMVFAGEASWRWKMLQPSTDRSYEYFWRQAARWLASSSPDPLTIGVAESLEPDDATDVTIEVRDRAFQPVGDATVEARLTIPGGETQPLTLRHEAGGGGRFVAAIHPDRAGAYRVQAQARRGTSNLGEADRWFYVGGSQREFADPRLNEGLLRRIARSSGGQYVRAADASRIPGWLQAVVPQHAELELRDLWHTPWAIALVIALLSAEWTLRRRWGLR